MKHLGSLEGTQEARIALGYASSNSYASFVLSKLPTCFISWWTHADVWINCYRHYNTDIVIHTFIFIFNQCLPNLTPSIYTPIPLYVDIVRHIYTCISFPLPALLKKKLLLNLFNNLKFWNFILWSEAFLLSHCWSCRGSKKIQCRNKVCHHHSRWETSGRWVALIRAYYTLRVN